MKKYNSNIKLGTATLNVVNFDRQLKFYTEVMGMTVISKNDIEATLGTSDNTPLLHLKKVDGPLVRSYGLYHIAYLVPDEQSLANILRHFIDSNVPLDGGQIVTDILRHVEFTEVKKGMKQGDKNMIVELPIIFIDVDRQS